MMSLQGALYPWRFRIVLALLALLVGVIAWRIVDLQVMDQGFLKARATRAAFAIFRFPRTGV